MKDFIQSLVKEENLPTTFIETVETWYLPIVEALAKLGTHKSHFIGIQGSQGSGKSTIAKFIKLMLEKGHGKRVAIMSLDDFYLTRSERAELAKHVHPLLATRGVPGTHDIDLARRVIRKLSHSKPQSETRIPRFNKAKDDRYPKDEWESFTGRADLIILEGWCVGASAQAEALLSEPMNYLEATEDHDETWRRYVNDALDQDYKELFALLDQLLVIQAPSFDCVYQWRMLQEEKLKQSVAAEAAPQTMSDEALRRFIAHYERLTRHCLNTLPDRADWVLYLDNKHHFTKLRRPADA
jgi:D-glycerate 3-kinase